MRISSLSHQFSSQCLSIKGESFKCAVDRTTTRAVVDCGMDTVHHRNLYIILVGKSNILNRYQAIRTGWRLVANSIGICKMLGNIIVRYIYIA